MSPDDDEPSMHIDFNEWEGSSRPCRFSLNLQDCCVYADFDVDAENLVYAVRVSFDGYGCARLPSDVRRMSPEDSRALLQMVSAQSVDIAIADPLLRRYFSQLTPGLWEDALRDHDLI